MLLAATPQLVVRSCFCALYYCLVFTEQLCSALLVVVFTSCSSSYAQQPAMTVQQQRMTMFNIDLFTLVERYLLIVVNRRSSYIKAAAALEQS
jgi:hypothetical protein